jgi:uncharacterized protein (TIGR00369 family)
VKIDPEREAKIRERFLYSNPFSRKLGMELDVVEKDRAVMSLAVKEDLLQVQGVMHGGAIASLIDTAVALAIAATSAPEDRFTTVELKINYLSSIRSGRARADARLIRNGRRIIVAECDVFDSNDKLCAKGLLTYIRTN